MKFELFLVVGACALLVVAQFLLPPTPFSHLLVRIGVVGLMLGVTIGFIKMCIVFIRTL